MTQEGVSHAADLMLGVKDHENCRVAGGIAAPGPHRSAREPLDSYGSCRPTVGLGTAVAPVHEQLRVPLADTL
jgi:hypothetical protein